MYSIPPELAAIDAHIRRRYKGCRLLSIESQFMVYMPWVFEARRFFFSHEMNTPVGARFIYADQLAPRCIRIEPCSSSELNATTTTAIINIALLEALSQGLWAVAFGRLDPEYVYLEMMGRIIQAVYPETFTTHAEANDFIEALPGAEHLRIDSDGRHRIARIRQNVLGSLRHEASLVDGLEWNYRDTLHNQIISLVTHFFLGHEIGHGILKDHTNMPLFLTEIVERSATTVAVHPHASRQLAEEVACDLLALENVLFQGRLYKIYDWLLLMVLAWISIYSRTMEYIFHQHHHAINFEEDRSRFIWDSLKRVPTDKHGNLGFRYAPISGDLMQLNLEILPRVNIFRSMVDAARRHVRSQNGT